MSWATLYIQKLKNNETVTFRPRGNSMTGKIESGQLCTVEPIKNYDELKKGDIVLCKVNGNQYLHLISAISGDRFQISNNHNFVNGWTNKNSVYGKLTKIEK
jgi:SOS-response transcriptional repressor LexA